jgi:RNA 3'-terminal phosphate cyclase
MIEIDASFGEGGGQVLRSALARVAITVYSQSCISSCETMS